MARARIVHLAEYGGPYGGSFIPMLIAAARESRAEGWEIELAFGPIARDRPWLAELAAEDIPVRFAPEGGRETTGPWLEDLVASTTGPLLLHTHFSAFDVTAAKLAREHRRVAAIWHVHTFLSRDPRIYVRNLYRFARFGRRVSAILCVNAGIAAAVRARGAPVERIEVLANGIDTARFRRVDAAERGRARERLGIDPSAELLVHFAWDWEVKGGPLFVRTMADLCRGRDTACAITVGGGPAAEAAVAAHGLGDRVRVIDSLADPRDLYAAADAFAATSTAEGLPFALLESLSSGIAVLATEIPGHALPGGGPSAVHRAPADPRRLAAVAGEILDRDRAEAERQSREAREWTERNLDVSVWAGRLREIYREALAAT